MTVVTPEDAAAMLATRNIERIKEITERHVAERLLKSKRARFKYVADHRITICLDGLRYVSCWDAAGTYFLRFGHKGHDENVSYGNKPADEIDRNLMYSKVVGFLEMRYGISFTTATDKATTTYGKTS